MDRRSVEKYLEGVREQNYSSDFIPRFFGTRKDWDRLSALDVHRSLEAFRDLQPSLADVLANPSAVILGEPGMGKSTLSRTAVISVLDLPTDGLRLPIRLELRSYLGSLTQLLEAHGLPAQLLDTRQVNGMTVVTTLILDGLDEVQEGYVEKLVVEIEQRLAMNHSFRALITCRQAFYATVREVFRNPPTEFYLLGFASSDIKTYLQRNNVETKAFLNEIGRLGLELETSNPFTLLTLTKYWRNFGRLANRRSEILAYVIEELIALRPRFAPRQQRRALQMLAMAMETACKNELTFEEANTVLVKAMPVSPTEAESILSELLHTILIRVSGNFVFQMRSYGEFLAAEEMATYSIERVMEFIYYRGTRIPNQSWTNAISYLVETNSAARAFLIAHHPRLVLTASPTVFTTHEGNSIVERVLDSLIEANESLIGHPYLNPAHLGRLVSDDTKARLLRDAEVNEPVRGANALALLAYAKQPEVLERSLRLIEDPTQNRLLRRAAISVIASVGDSALIPRLYKRLDQADALQLTIVDCICALTDENFIPEVLRLLLTTDAMVSSAYVRFRDFDSRESLVAVLDFLLSNPNAINTRRLSAYIVPVLELLDEYWDQTLSDKVADLIVAWEAETPTERLSNAFLPSLSALGEMTLRVALQSGFWTPL